MKRVCHRCGKERQILGDPEDPGFGFCRTCARQIAKHRDKHKRLDHTDEGRTCCVCRRSLPNDAFTWRKNGKPFSACKECNKFVYSARRRARKVTA